MLELFKLEEWTQMEISMIFKRSWSRVIKPSLPKHLEEVGGRRNMEGEKNENKWDGDCIQLVHIYIVFQSFLIVLRQANIWAKQRSGFPPGIYVI